MYLISPQGGAPRPFQPEFALSNSDTCGSPVWSSDGKYIIFNGRRVGDPASQDWWVAQVDGGPAVRRGPKATFPLPPVWQSPEAWEGEYIYYSTGTTVEGVNLFRVRINKRNWTVSGPAERITAGAGMQYGASVAHEGRILFSNSVYTDNIWSLQAKQTSPTRQENRSRSRQI